MSKRLQLRRGTTAEHSTFTGAVGEVTVDTDKDALIVHDGNTAGGHESATKIYVDNADALKADKSYVDNADALKADKSYVDNADVLKADKTNVLELDNTVEFTPTEDYEPATKKYVDDNADDLKADKSSVLMLDNTDPFTPDADYEPATKKYVDDEASQAGESYKQQLMTLSGTFTVPSNVYKVYVRLSGGSGGQGGGGDSGYGGDDGGSGGTTIFDSNIPVSCAGGSGGADSKYSYYGSPGGSGGTTQGAAGGSVYGDSLSDDTFKFPTEVDVTPGEVITVIIGSGGSGGAGCCGGSNGSSGEDGICFIFWYE